MKRRSRPTARMRLRDCCTRSSRTRPCSGARRRVDVLFVEQGARHLRGQGDFVSTRSRTRRSNWDGRFLVEMLDRCSTPPDSKVTRFAEILERGTDATAGLHEMIERSMHSPRELIRLLSAVVREHEERQRDIDRPTPSMMLPSQTASIGTASTPCLRRTQRPTLTQVYRLGGPFLNSTFRRRLASARRPPGSAFGIGATLASLLRAAIGRWAARKSPLSSTPYHRSTPSPRHRTEARPENQLDLSLDLAGKRHGSIQQCGVDAGRTRFASRFLAR